MMNEVAKQIWFIVSNLEFLSHFLGKLCILKKIYENDVLLKTVSIITQYLMCT